MVRGCLALKALLLTASFVVCGSMPLNAATFKPVLAQYHWPQMGILMEGRIELGDAERLEASISEAVIAYPDHRMRALGLISPGGNVGEAIAIIRVIQKYGLATIVPEEQTCASACVLLFAAGSIKIMSPTARIGIHGASDAISGVQDTGALATTTEMAKIYAELGVPASVIGRMVVTEPDDIIWLSDDEIRMFPRGYVQRATLQDFPIQLSGYDGTFSAPNAPTYLPGLTDPNLPSYQRTNRGVPQVSTPSPHMLPPPAHTAELLKEATEYSEGYLFAVKQNHPDCNGYGDWQRGCIGGLDVRSKPYFSGSDKEWPLEQRIASWLESYDYAYQTKEPGFCGNGSYPSVDGCKKGSKAWPRSERP